MELPKTAIILISCKKSMKSNPAGESHVDEKRLFNAFI